MGEELKVTPVSELKGATSELVKCTKSGHVYRIGKMQLPTMAYLFGAVDFSKDFMTLLKEPETARPLLEAIHKTVPQCILEPRITKMPTADSITPEELDPIDEIELFPKILKLSGYSAEKVEAAEKFREESSGTVSTPDSGNQPPATV